MDKTNFSARRRVWSAVMRCLMVLCAALTCALAAFLVIYVLVKGVPNLSWALLRTKPSYLEGTIGILPDIISTVCMVLTTLVVVLPVGVCAAVYLTEYARNRRLPPSSTRRRRCRAFRPSSTDWWGRCSSASSWG